MRGFWGIRLIIEELVAQANADDYVSRVAPAPNGPSVMSTVGAAGDAWADDMVSRLTAALGTQHFEDFDEQHSLLERMWDPEQRPAVLVVVGHLTNTRVSSEPDRPRIYVRALERFLDTDGIREAKRRAGRSGREGRWTPPTRSIILLLGCDTGRSGLGEVHSFVTGLSSAGAATVVATEEKIDTRLAGDLAQTVVPRLGTMGAGDAVRSWRLRLMQQGNPLGLVVTCFGSAGAYVPDLA